MIENIHIPISLSSEEALKNLDDVNFVLKNSGNGKQFKRSEIGSGDTITIDYQFTATYLGNLPATLKIVQRLSQSHGARATEKVKMLLTDVLKSLEAL